VTGPHPATAAIRLAVRETLGECDPGDLVLVACSGGADSLALAAAVAFEAPGLAVRAGAVVVDHQLAAGSESVARTVQDQCRDLGLDPVRVRPVTVAGGGSLEAAARAARYAALEDVARDTGAALVLLGHTLDDQAEQVLLGLTRGAGARSLSGMPGTRGRFRRPLLDVRREQCRESLLTQGLEWWDDPMNEDPAFTRVRARRALADLERDLGPGVAAALGRTASLLRDDADHLDALADAAVTALGAQPWQVGELSGIPRAVRTRAWRRLLIAAGAPAGQVGTRHTEACDRLLTGWHGQGPVHAPGDLRVRRSAGWVTIGAADPVD